MAGEELDAVAGFEEAQVAEAAVGGDDVGGDALFVVLDPYWYTTTKPHHGGVGVGSGDRWDRTLGREQYDWLRDTLASSSAGYLSHCFFV